MSTIPEMFDAAVRHHQAGNLATAEPLYRRVIQSDPGHADALHLLGILTHQAGRHEAATALVRQAIVLNSSDANIHYNLGSILVAQRRFAEAAVCFRAALAIDPHLTIAHYNLANALRDQGQLLEAASSYRQALRLDPTYADAHNNLGGALVGLGQLAEAAVCYRQVLRLDPGRADSYVNLGNVLHRQGQFVHAADCCRQALRLSPDYAEAHAGLGNALFWLGELDQAIDSYRQALRIKPLYAEAYNDLGSAYVWQGRLAEAAECFAQALRIDAGHQLALWNRACLRLSRGDFLGGWPDYELRTAQVGSVKRSFRAPRWDGTPLAGKTILVYAEQGLGDTLQFARYLPMVKESGGIIVFECQPALAKLLVGISGVDQLICTGAPLPAFDVQISLVSLPGLFGTTLNNIPASVPYITVDPELIEQWRPDTGRKPAADADLAVPAVERNIGIVWQGSMNQKTAKGDRRSLPLAHFDALAHVGGSRLFSLQIGPPAEQLRTITFPVIDLGSRFDPNSMADVAAAMQNLHLVITVDTAVAHLAGALGVPAWVLLPFAADWRWLLDRSDSPWYPTLRLFRQRQLGDWQEVFERLAAELRKEGRSQESGVRSKEEIPDFLSGS